MQNDVIEIIMNQYRNRIWSGRIKEEKAKRIIEKYAEKTKQAPTANRVMILKCLVLSGDDMPIDAETATDFHKTYRQCDVIFTSGFGSYDSIMWNLMHLDATIWDVLSEEGYN
ncbi:hypothetical protein [Escherichia phage vB_EcoM_011D4]|uniref:Uncharacterized protein n=1 Tax=Escherichia phage vB_EcoM_011D4 TaxID=2735300 RepID=A0A7D7F8W0_9CAUD|nr:hypothetical protein [Escherichia phage vB_EcoM_011D4]